MGWEDSSCGQERSSELYPFGQDPKLFNPHRYLSTYSGTPRTGPNPMGKFSSLGDMCFRNWYDVCQYIVGLSRLVLPPCVALEIMYKHCLPFGTAASGDPVLTSDTVCKNKLCGVVWYGSVNVAG